MVNAVDDVGDGGKKGIGFDLFEGLGDGFGSERTADLFEGIEL